MFVNKFLNCFQPIGDTKQNSLLIIPKSAFFGTRFENPKTKRKYLNCFYICFYILVVFGRYNQVVSFLSLQDSSWNLTMNEIFKKKAKFHTIANISRRRQVIYKELSLEFMINWIPSSIDEWTDFFKNFKSSPVISLVQTSAMRFYMRYLVIWPNCLVSCWIYYTQ